MNVRRVVLLALVSLCSAGVFAYSTGYTNTTLKTTGSGCTGCHAAGSGVTVAISGPSSMFPGQTAMFTITLNKTGVDGQKMGFNVAASDTTLAAFPGEPIASGGGELTHSSNVGTLHTLSSGTANYKFNWTMPAAAAMASTHTIYGVGLHGPKASSGWAHASNFTVTTAPPPAPTSLTTGTITSSSIVLNWAGIAPEFRLLQKSGSAPTTPTDGTKIYEGTLKTFTATSLAPSTKYYFAVYSKLTGVNTFSTTAASTSGTTLAAAPAGTIYVNASTGNDAGLGTQASPFKTITHAYAVAAAGNLILVAPGTYNTALGEVFPIMIKSGVQLKSSGGAPTTIVDASGASPRTRVMNAVASVGGTLVEGFTIKGGLFTPPVDGSYALGGGIYIDSNDATTFSRNIITGNEGRGYSGTGGLYPSGGGVFGGGVYVSSSSPTFVNNVISNNIARGGNGYSIYGTPNTTGGSGGYAEGGGIYAGGSGVYINNTFVGNQAIGGNGGFGDQGGGGGDGTGAAGSIYTGTIKNNIFANSTATGGAKGFGSTTDGTAGTAGIGGLKACCATVTNNLFFGNGDEGTDTGTAAVIGQNPQFVSSTNFHVTSSSPAKGKGTSTGAPAIDLDGTTRLSPPTIGAYEAATGGDANGDNAVTPADVVYILNFLYGGGPNPGAAADVNGDAKVDALDVFYLINYLFGGGAPPA